MKLNSGAKCLDFDPNLLYIAHTSLKIHFSHTPKVPKFHELVIFFKVSEDSKQKLDLADQRCSETSFMPFYKSM